MNRRSGNFYISRIRLINFHNFCNETISIAEGGHLFMLGDNASGKTTVLDAIHYVLTAGEDMEFNAAARVSGSKQQGRRIQSIITRYNVDTGHMRPSGGVAYAALEIMSAGRRPTSVAIGMSVNSPEEQVTRWGIIRDCYLEEIPFLVKDADGERPRDRQEMKKALGDNGFYGQPQAFCSQLAERFLGGKSQFADFCRFLKIGKAYREIAAHTSDYHALFKQLLPESDKDVFDRIIESLKSIDGARGDLDNLSRKLDYIGNLMSLLDGIREANRDVVVFEGVEQLIQIMHAGQSILEDLENISKLRAEEKKLAESMAKLEEREFKLNSRCNDMKAEDSGGALVREQELLDKLKRESERLQNDKFKIDTTRAEIQKIEAEAKSVGKRLRELLEALMKKLPDKSSGEGIDTEAAVEAVEECLRSPDEAAAASLEPALDALLSGIRTMIADQKTTLAYCEKGIQDCQEGEAELKSEDQSLRERREAMPRHRDFDLLVEDLDRAMIRYVPLYKGLEWHPDLSQEQKAQVEELIGEEILSIISVEEDEYRRAADIVLKKHPGHRLAVSKEGADVPADFRKWAASVFDVKLCGPGILEILLRELSAPKPPAFESWKGLKTVKFRSHAMAFSGKESRFIGSDSREKEQKRRLKEIAARLKENSNEVRELEKEQKEIKARLRALAANEGAILQSMKDIRDCVQKRKELQITVDHKRAALADLEQKSDSLSEEMVNDNIHLQKLQKIIKDKNIEELSKSLKELESQVKKCRDDISLVKESIMRCRFQAEAAQDRVAKNEMARKDCEATLERKLAMLEKKYGQPNPKALVEKLRIEKRLHVEADAVRKAIECRQQANAKQTEIKLLIKDIAGAGYGFSFDVENNQLFARGGIPVASVWENLHKNVEEQRTLINEKTTELFKKLIMDTMLRTLYVNVHRLDSMVAEINKLLKGRYFGSNTYRIKVRPCEQYEGLLKLIKSFSSYNPDLEVKLSQFFEDHKDVLINTPPGTIPEMLDYRNWFHYEMFVLSGAGDGTVMDSKVKSIGSGGEQAVPNYLLVLTIAHFMYGGANIKLNVLLFDEAFYGIDSQRRDQLMGFATDLGLQLFVASPDQDGVKDEIACSTSLLIVKDAKYDVHLYPFHWKRVEDADLFDTEKEAKGVKFDKEL